MAQLIEECKNHDFVEYDSSLKKTYSDEYCRYCGLNRKPVFVNGEFSEWFYFHQPVHIGAYSYLGRGPIKFLYKR